MSAGAFPVFLAGALETAINQALRLDEEACAALGQLSGKVIVLELAGVGITLYILPDAHGLVLLSRYEGEVDAQIRAAPFSLLRLFQQGDTRLLSNGGVRLSGEIGTAQRLTEIFRSLDIDWEEPLARVLGDAPAHWLGRLLRRAGQWRQDSVMTWEHNLSEYAQEELRLLPVSAEVEGLLHEVDRLRADSDRLEQRLLRLEHLAGKT